MNIIEEFNSNMKNIPSIYLDEYIKEFGSLLASYIKSDEILEIIIPYTKRITESVNNDVEMIGKILRYHLEMESMLNDYIRYHYKDSMDIKVLLNLSFYKKIALIKKVPFFHDQFEIIFKGLKELNEIRNKLAHNIENNFSVIKTDNLDKIIEELKKKKYILAETLALEYVTLLNKVRFFCLYSYGFLLCFYGKGEESLIQRYKNFNEDFLSARRK